MSEQKEFEKWADKLKLPADKKETCPICNGKSFEELEPLEYEELCCLHYLKLLYSLIL